MHTTVKALSCARLRSVHKATFRLTNTDYELGLRDFAVVLQVLAVVLR